MLYRKTPSQAPRLLLRIVGATAVVGANACAAEPLAGISPLPPPEDAGGDSRSPGCSPSSPCGLVVYPDAAPVVVGSVGSPYPQVGVVDASLPDDDGSPCCGSVAAVPLEDGGAEHVDDASPVGVIGGIIVYPPDGGGPCGGHVCGVVVAPDGGGPCGGHVCGVVVAPDGGGPCGGHVCGVVVAPDGGGPCTLGTAGCPVLGVVVRP